MFAAAGTVAPATWKIVPLLVMVFANAAVSVPSTIKVFPLATVNAGAILPTINVVPEAIV